MDFYALFKIIQKYPGYKLFADNLRLQILASRQDGGICWSQFSLRLKEFFPDIYLYLENNRELYREKVAENIKFKKQGCAFLIFGEEQYPQGLYLTEDPPLCLSYLGHPHWQQNHCIAVVGSREPRDESLIWMEKELTEFIERHHTPIVSGGARGVDQKAHAIAVRKNLPTTVVLPSGLGSVYPSSLQNWMTPVLDAGGCFLSEYAHEQKMQKFLFHHRNRLIAALGCLILVVEARKRSGTLITAQLGAQWGRPVMVVPGHPLDSHFAGCLDLLAEGAELARDAQDLDILFQAEFWSTSQLTADVGLNV